MTVMHAEPWDFEEDFTSVELNGTQWQCYVRGLDTNERRIALVAKKRAELRKRLNEEVFVVCPNPAGSLTRRSSGVSHA